MIRKQDGFTMVELMITMVIFVLVIVAASNIFTTMLTQFKQQSRIAESNIEGNVNLEYFRSEIQKAGFGLPWVLNGINYNEAQNDGTTPWVDTLLNDDNGGANSNPPRAVVFEDNIGFNGSDVIAIKATNIAMNEASQNFTSQSNYDEIIDLPVNWAGSGDDLQAGDNIIVIKMIDGKDYVVLQNDGATCYTAFPPAGGFLPVIYSNNTYLIYGISPNGTAPRMPFNRADFYVRKPTTANSLPQRCAAGNPTNNPNNGTGILYKGVVNHTDGNLTEYQLLDCVADMQMYFGLDTNEDGELDTTSNSLAGMDASAIRKRLKEIRVFILAQEGQKDPDYVFNNFTGSPAAPYNNACPGACPTCIHVGDATCLGGDFDLAANITDYQRYRWKVYTMIIQPYNLR